ncbi:MAG: hypothetical protein RLZZ628_3190 [Bacteroidota bacterium]|jgi:hypothetical protein
MIIGTFDIVLIVILLGFNLVFRQWIFKQKIGCLLIIILFGLILPLCSMKVELNRVLALRKSDEIHEAWELAYTFLKFKFYWLVGLLQIIIIRNRPQ